MYIWYLLLSSIHLCELLNSAVTMPYLIALPSATYTYFQLWEEKGRPRKRSPKVKKPTSSSQRNVAVPSPIQTASRSTAKTKQPTVIPSCCGCSIMVTDETGALQCDRCMSNKIWKCADSLNLSSEMYHHQVSDCSPVLCWFCNNCEKIVMSINHNGTGQQNEKSTIWSH